MSGTDLQVPNRKLARQGLKQEDARLSVKATAVPCVAMPSLRGDVHGVREGSVLLWQQGNPPNSHGVSCRGSLLPLDMTGHGLQPMNQCTILGWTELGLWCLSTIPVHLTMVLGLCHSLRSTAPLLDTKHVPVLGLCRSCHPPVYDPVIVRRVWIVNAADPIALLYLVFLP